MEGVSCEYDSLEISIHISLGVRRPGKCCKKQLTQSSLLQELKCKECIL